MQRISEEQLSAAFATLLPACGTALPSLPVVLSEFEALQGRADYVAAGGATAELEQPGASEWGRALARPAAAAIYRQLGNAPRTLRRLVERTGLTERTVRECLRVLCSSGLANENPTGSFVRTSTQLPKVDLWAFEVKVSDWRRALFQAVQYQAFAHHVAVVMPGEYAHRAVAHIHLFRKFGVGLLAVENLDTTPTLRRVAAPRRRSPSSGTYHLHALGRVMSTAS